MAKVIIGSARIDEHGKATVIIKGGNNKWQ